MTLSLSRWRSGHLLAAWCAYWAGLAAATLSPAVLAIIRATSSGPGKGTVTASLADWVLTITVSAGGKPTFTGSAHLLPAALWIAGPPLALYGLWLLRRSSESAAAQHRATVGEASPSPELPPPPGIGQPESARASARVPRA